jgi:hypothetical protein
VPVAVAAAIAVLAVAAAATAATATAATTMRRQQHPLRCPADISDREGLESAQDAASRLWFRGAVPLSTPALRVTIDSFPGG